MKLDNFILLLFCFLFGFDDMRVITMVIVKEILFTCLIYSTNINHQSERDMTDFNELIPILIW